MSAPDFCAALRAASAPVIAEVKPFSPAAGDLIGGRSVSEIATAYARAGVPCVSVTTGQWHGGTPAMIADLAATGLPVLRKDFIVSRSHLEESARWGASAVLLTCTLLRPRDLARLAALALDLGLTPFVEAASAAELEGLSLPEGAVLAVNNRNIRQRETDGGGIERSLSLRSMARRVQPQGLLVSASGITRPEQATQVLAAGFDGVLIGTALMGDGQSDPEATARAFLAAARQALPV
ncbi:MAG: hypothetical protein JNN06_14205 [Gemmobacter sp.]|uniref:hypothetical protein n=1 Tax=Gemmobacter sp. TaxID=1898957 RepID=UPI001A3FA9DB|nr:hypothetical protein [Gemmobacter sp.]MBL8563427.1 hypothetical protein [Gemmobacter sp.]